MEATISAFKHVLERVACIHSWQPTESELRQIAAKLTQQRASSPLDVSAAVTTSVRENPTFRAFEGVDNSDLVLLLRLASQVRVV